jgi:hypothetical protein
MFQFEPHEAFEIIRRGQLIDLLDGDKDSTTGRSSGTLGDREIVVVSIFGTSQLDLDECPGFKRAFRLAIDTFGRVSLFQPVSKGKPVVDNLDNNKASRGNNCSPIASGLTGSGDELNTRSGSGTACESGDSLAKKVETLDLNERDTDTDGCSRRNANNVDIDRDGVQFEIHNVETGRLGVDMDSKDVDVESDKVVAGKTNVEPRVDDDDAGHKCLPPEEGKGVAAAAGSPHVTRRIEDLVSFGRNSSQKGKSTTM